MRESDILVTAETVDGGKLREAAQRKDDKRILIQIQEKDCVALEVKYHRRCYSTYTLFLRQTSSGIDDDDDVDGSGKILYTDSFNVFCNEFVKKKIIQKQKIYYMKRLFEEFVKTVLHVEKCDASSYRVFRLKRRLRKRYPQLVFCRPSAKNKSEIVFVEDLSQSHVIYENQMNLADDSSSQSETEGEDEDENTEVKENEPWDMEQTSLRELYHVALALRDILSKSPKWYENWPPLSSDITGDKVKKTVPTILFNFLAWMLGASTDPELSHYVEVNEGLRTKIFSVAQDLVYIATKGRSQTPKSLALAMAVRQISGCSGLINILNGLGHCVSLPSAMAHDTAIAQLNIDTTTIIPREFVANKFINLVYDNIDFGEEAAKQTHVTNGIITQKVSDKGSRHERATVQNAKNSKSTPN